MNNFAFWHPLFTPSSAAPQSHILDLAGLFLRFAQSVATKSDANLGANFMAPAQFLAEEQTTRIFPEHLFRMDADNGCG
jgi:hypothetical protein